MTGSFVFEVFEGEDGKWYWHCVCENNGLVIADGGEGYHSSGNARRAIKTFRNALYMGRITEVPRPKVEGRTRIIPANPEDFS